MDSSIVVSTTLYHQLFDPVAIIVNAVVGLIFLGIWAILRFYFYRQVLKENFDGPNNIHLETNLAIEEQQKSFFANGGNAEKKLTQPTDQQKGMALIRKVIGKENAAKLKKELEGRGLELDGEAIEKYQKKAGRELLINTMAKNLCGPEEAMKIILKKEATIALKKDPEFEQKLKTDSELAKQALEFGIINKKQLEQYQAELTAANVSAPESSPVTTPEAVQIAAGTL